MVNSIFTYAPRTKTTYRSYVFPLHTGPFVHKDIIGLTILSDTMCTPRLLYFFMKPYVMKSGIDILKGSDNEKNIT